MIENIGDKAINYYLKAVNFFAFVIRCLIYILNPIFYFKVNLNSLSNHIYFSGVKNLVPFVFLALFLGSALIVVAVIFAINYSLQDQIGEILVTFIINEFAPLFTTVFILYKYGFKIYNIKVTDENTNNIYGDLYLPNILSNLIVVPSMALIFATVMLLSGYVVSSLYLNIDIDTYKSMIISAIELKNIITLLAKGVIFGFIASILPTYQLYKCKNDLNNLNCIKKINTAERTMKVLGSLFSLILFVEVLSLLIVY
jgi:phospholipid/cholesterol/gamma-HCH transport system permease protein